MKNGLPKLFLLAVLFSSSVILVEAVQDLDVSITLELYEQDNYLWAKGDIIGSEEILYNKPVYIIVYNPLDHIQDQYQGFTKELDEATPEEHGYRFQIVDLSRSLMDGEWVVQAWFPGDEDWATCEDYAEFNVIDNRYVSMDDGPIRLNSTLEVIYGDTPYDVGNTCFFSITLKDAVSDTPLKDQRVWVSVRRPDQSTHELSGYTDDSGLVTISVVFDMEGGTRVRIYWMGNEDYYPSEEVAYFRVNPGAFRLPSFPIASQLIGVLIALTMLYYVRNAPSNTDYFLHD